MGGPIRGRNQVQRAARWGLAVAGSWLLGTGLAVGQSPGGEPSVLAKWGLAPSYRTDYKVGESDRDWKQTLNLDRASRYVDLDVRMSSQRRENERRNNFERSDDKLYLNFGRSIPIGTLKLETAFKRLSDSTDRSKSANTDGAVDLASRLTLLQGERSRFNLNLSTGYLREVNVQERYGTRSSTDSTTAVGWTNGAAMDAAWDPSKSVSVTSSVSYGNTVQESKTVRYEFDDESVTLTEQDDTDRSHRLDMRGAVEWSRYSLLSISADAVYSDALTQYYQSTEGAQETKSIFQQSTTFRFFGEHEQKFGYMVEFYNNENQTDYELATNARKNTTDDIMIDAYYVLGALPGVGRIPLVAGSEMSARFISADGRVATEGTNSYDQTRLDFSSELRRSFGRQIEFVGKYKESLTQDLYDNQQLDKDRLRSEITATLKYRPSDTFNANVSYTTNTEETIEVPDESAIETQRKEDYNVQGKYTMLLPFDVSITQTLQLGATYTFYVFNEAQNSLTRNNRVVTELMIPVYDNTEIRVQHSFKRNDSGAYLYSDDSRVRTYSKSRERLTQNMRIGMKYDIIKGVYLAAEEIIDLSYSTTLSTNTTRTTEKYEFTAEAGITHDFTNGIRLRASAERINSSVKDDFYRVNASLEKTFK